MNREKEWLKRGIALFLATAIASMSALPYLPNNLLQAWGFGLVFVSSGSPGHPYLQGRPEGESRTTWFLCLNEGASARSGYDYSKINADVSYSEGSLWEKQLFWAYIGAFGSYDNASGMEQYKNQISKEQAKQVAWKNSVPAWVDKMANGGFMGLENIPAGCMQPEDIFALTSKYGEPENPMSVNSLLSSPGVIDAAKLYQMCGLDSWDTFRKYCTVTVVSAPENTVVTCETTDTGISFAAKSPDGAYVAGQNTDLLIKVQYDPAVFKVVKVSGMIEYYKCNVPGSQQLARVKGDIAVTYPEFYLTSGKGGSGITGGGGGSGSNGGNLGTDSGITVITYEHKETFESNYRVELKKYDYETGKPLKDSVWQVLERFTDKGKLRSDETGGSLVEGNMREAPTTWDGWMIFEDDMKTDAEGSIIHWDRRSYDFKHTYCDGHPLPPEPEGGDDEEGGDDSDDLMEEWQAAVDECAGKAASSGGTHHHWLCGTEEIQGEAASFEQSGCREARDQAYQNFINLRYSYTFRETDARDGYIIHGENGHPDDVPVEIITTAASEAGEEEEWTECSNEAIVVSGYVRNMADSKDDDHEGEFYYEGGFHDEGGSGDDTGGGGSVSWLTYLSKAAAASTERGARGIVPDADSERQKLYLTESYDLSKGQQVENALRRFFGLPERWVSENSFTVNIVAEDSVELATASQADPYEEVDLINDLADDPVNEIPETEASVPEPGMATGSNASEKTGRVLSRSAHNTGSVNASYEEDEELDDYEPATPSDLPSTYRYERGSLRLPSGDEDGSIASRTAALAYTTYSGIQDSRPDVVPGPHDRVAHVFVVYDHRVPGQVHFNKRDLELVAGETDEYDSYGDTQGDTALEGAVYGLFAAADIYGPDTQRGMDGSVEHGTGIIFDANDLVAVAATDKNGDGSFMAITEKPHSVYNYQTGQIEYTGKAYPKNLYDKNGYEKVYEEEETGRIYRDCLGENGDWWIGRPLILGNYYIKELTRSEGYELSISGKDMELTNAAGAGRAGYGAGEDDMAHPAGSAWITRQLKHAVTFPEANSAYGNTENLLTVEVGSRDAVDGFNLVFDGIPEGANFYYDNVVTEKVKVKVAVNHVWADAIEAPLYMTAEDSAVLKRDIDGKPIENPDAVRDFPVPYVGYAREAKKLQSSGSVAAADPSGYNAAFQDTNQNIKYIKYETEQMMRQMGIDTPKDGSRYSTPAIPVYDEAGGGTYGMPEITLSIANVGTNKSLIDAVLAYFTEQKVFSYGSVQKLERNGTTVNVTIAVGMQPMKTFLYETDDSGEIIAAYLFKINESTGRYVMRKYVGEHVVVTELSGVTSDRRMVQVLPDFTINGSGMPVDVLTYRSELNRYLHYEAGDILYDYCYADGSGHEPVHRKVYRPVYEEQEVEEEHTETSRITMVDSREEVADPAGSTYVYRDPVSGQYIVHVGSRDADLTGSKSSGFTVALPNGSTSVTEADIQKIGSNNVWGIKAGDFLCNAEYLIRIAGAGAGVAAVEDFDQNTSYIKNQRLIYNGNHDISEDGNTRINPAPVRERAVKQEIKVVKDIEKTSYNNTNSYTEVHKDWWTDMFGGFGFLGNGKAAGKMDNFRFKVYLKSNLERIYRDNDGNIVWQDSRGTDLDASQVLRSKEQFPALVQKIYTKVPHKTAPLYQDSRDAVIAGTELYSHTQGLISQEQNSGYTAVLETLERLAEDGTGTRMVKAYNYEKFFDAIAVANHDKWDDAAPTYTGWQPIGNAANRTGYAIENARVSDAVRQFAIDWYLDDEVKKLVRPVAVNRAETEDADGKASYSDELYDEALRAAIIKAENYLKPFFAFDLDEIYAVAWDSAEDGGNDHDRTTLSADSLYGDAAADGEGYYYGISSYLPYGTYVVVEQQPGYADRKDFANKHYQTDRPEEVILPAVYADYTGSQASPEVMNDYYNYAARISQPELERRYKIRFNEESHVIQSRNEKGDFEIYKYGLAIDRISNGAGSAGAGDFFALTQAEYKPYKNNYNEQDDRTAGNVPYYLSEGQSGRDGISRDYRYSSVSEHAGRADDVPYIDGSVTDDNVPGIRYRDKVSTMHGVQIAFDGKYASMLVPWTVAAPDNGASEEADSRTGADGESSYRGYSYAKLRNRFYTAKLRLEKLDSETHENILHDGAVFAIYAAKRDDSPDGDGRVMFYEKPTTISGTELFLKAMGAADIRPMARRLSFWDRLTGKEYGPGNLYTGVVPAGTPVCEESGRIVLGDSFGNQTVAFKSYSTVLDGYMKNEATDTYRSWQYQTVGYLETPQPLGAGTYVIVEEKAPAGYARSKPVAVEVYSDMVTYYKEGNKDSRVLAALYEYESDNRTAYGTKPQDVVKLARVNIENEPIKLTVEKLKESSRDRANTTEDKTVTYQVSGRIDGTLTEIGGRPDYVYAYENGEYLGYAWKKGTLEYLAARKAAGEQVEPVFEGTVFAGYGYVTRALETADDENPYVAGAVMALFDALELVPSGDSEDHAYEGLVIERNLTNNITRMYVKEGYAGEKVDFVKEKDESGKEYVTEYQAGTDSSGQPVIRTGNIWAAVTLKRHDTDILYYDLDNLEVLASETINGRKMTYGYGRNHEKISIDQLESEKANIERTDTPHAIYAFRGGVPYLEFVGGDFRKIRYSAWNKVITVDPRTQIYHLDRDGNRDALVDPYTGMAYVIKQEDGQEKVLVWPVLLRRDEHGTIISRDKITTSRVATIGENEAGYGEKEILEVVNHSGKELLEEDRPSYAHTESGYLTGSWNGKGSGESHQEITVHTSKNGRNLNGEVLTDQNNGAFEKNLNPVVDEHGLPVYYQRSKEVYDKGTELYDRNDVFVRYQDSDNLEEYNNNAYHILEHDPLYDGDTAKEQQQQKPLYHRLGEGYILENTWVTSDQTPNDPFHDQMTDGQADILKRVPAGTYIMEELASPAGYLRGMPVGITVHETSGLQQVSMVDQTTKVEIAKLDGAQDAASELGSYGFGMVPGAVLALYEAERIYTSDLKQYPKGYYMRKTGLLPFRYLSTGHTADNRQELTARWMTKNSPVYAEGIPAGDYILEELRTPAGFVTSAPVELEIENTAQVQSFLMYNDHTKVEFEKYHLEDGKERLLADAEFALYPVVMDAEGRVVYKDGSPEFYEDQEADCWKTYDGAVFREFLPAFEAMYREYGAKPGLSLSWAVDGQDYHAVCESVEKLDAALGGGSETGFPDRAVLLMRTGEGTLIRVSVYGQHANRGGRAFTFEYQFNYRKLPWINEYAASYDTLEGRHRIDYLPAGSCYVLRETRVPHGFARAKDMLVEVTDTPQVHRYRVENQEGMLLISKTLKNVDGELTGAHLALYRADEKGKLVQEQEYLVEDWLTGGDGAYTEADEINRRIPDGFQKGDLKPHPVRRLDDGIYWLVELGSPDYVNTFEPVRVDYRQGDEIRVIRTEDTMAQGELSIHKMDEQETPLTGAVYELSAFRQADLRTPLFTRMVSGAEASICISGLPVGEIGGGGRITPYRYRLKEVVPPDGYAVNTEIFTWQFEPDRQGISYAFGETAKKEISVVNRKTRIVIGKRDFDVFGDKDTLGAFVEGAELAVYEVTGRDEKDALIYDESAPCDLWVTGGKPEENGHVMEGLVAGHSYLLKERKAPEGYHVMQPILFTLSTDGRRIASVSNRLNTITVHTIIPADINMDTDNPDMDSIQAVTIRGRYAVGVDCILTGQDGEEIARWRAVAEDHVLVQDGKLTEGKTCTLTEITRYSDGSEAVTGRTTKTLYFDENGQCRLPGRVAETVTVTMQHGNGAVIDSFSPGELVQEKTIRNNVTPESPKITMKNKNGHYGDVLNAGQAVFNTVSFVNTSYQTETMEIVISAGEGTEIIDGGTGVLENGRLVFRVPDMDAFAAGQVSFVTSVEEGQLSSALTAAVHSNGNICVATKTVPVMQKNQLTVFNELTGSGKRLFADEESRFTIRLFHGRTGEELKGSYRYQGSRSGYIRSGDTLALAGNEFVTIDPDLYRNVRYEVVREEDGRIIHAWGESTDQEEKDAGRVAGAVSSEAGGFAVFTRALPDTLDRERFRKGESYILTETTTYTDGTVLESGRMQVTLGEQGSIESITAMDKKARVRLSKVEISGNRELPGCEMELQDQKGNVIDTWISGNKPYDLEGVLIPGETYTLIEVNPAPGYSWAEEITFTVNEDGTTEQVVMADRPTHVTVAKTDSGTGRLTGGALLQVLDEQGNIQESWVSGEECHEIKAKLRAGQLYYLHEERAPSGYQKRADLAFIVPGNGDILEIIFTNDKTRYSGRSSDEPRTEQPKKIGRITVHYKAGLSAAGQQVRTASSYERTVTLPGGKALSKTGDNSRSGWYACIMALALAGIVGCMVWIRKGKQRAS